MICILKATHYHQLMFLKTLENSRKDLSEFNEDFLKSYNEKSNEGYFFEVDVQYLENLDETHNDLSFLLEVKNFDKVKNLQLTFKIKNNISYK